MKGIQTEYKSVKFRSRLEAKWATFFDLLGWRWEYEPFDCDGWIPDFAIVGKHRMTLVEVKPIIAFDNGVAEKIDAADGIHEVLMLGIGPEDTDDYCPQLGWLREVFDHDGAVEIYGWGPARLGRWLSDNPSDVIGFCSEYGSFSDRITGSYDGGNYGDGHLDWPEIQHLWARAQNRTQWRAPA